MLSRLRVKNLALVENISIDFKDGLNIVTGETGAGKSILIGALNLLLGERADKSIIRTGEDACGSEATFELADTSAVDSVLTEFGLDPCEDKQLVIRRIVKISGAGQNLVNDSSVTLQVLRRLGEALVDMHGPHQHQSLLSQDCQLEILDAYGRLDSELKSFQAQYRQMLALQERRDQLEIDDETVADQIERLNFCIEDIEGAQIKDGEEDEVYAEHQLAGNAHRILELSGNVARVLSESDNSVFDQLTGIHRDLDGLARILPAAEDWRNEIEAITSQVQDIAGDVARQVDESSVNPARLTWLDQRLATFQRLKRKYGATMEEVQERLRNSKSRLEDLQSREERIGELDEQIERQREVVFDEGRKLRAAREKVAVKLAGSITEELKALGFAHGEFSVEMREKQPSFSGMDEVDYGFAPNVGEQMRPLRQIASSGEISRVMLACKVVLARHDRIPVLVFDEIDANLGGETGYPVGAKLLEVAGAHQVICITHLPQVAVHGNQHYSVAKYVSDGRTFSKISRASGEERVAEVARMLGDGRSKAALEHARAMLQSEDSEIELFD